MALLDSLKDGIRWMTGSQTAIRRAIETINGYEGIQLAFADRDGFLLLVPWEQEVYRVIVVSTDDRIAVISVESQIRFPAGRLPPNACKALDELNERMQNCYYDALHCDTFSVYVVRTRVNVADISARAFLHWFKTLIEPTQLVDRLLRKYGYA